MNSAKTGRAALLAALNAAANEGVSFLASDLSFAAPEASTNPNREVQVVYSATPDSLFEGSATAFYDRLDLTAWFASYNINNIEVLQGDETVGALVEKLNTRFDLGFTDDDFDFAQAIEPGSDSIVLEALPGSFAFKGQLLVSLVVDKLPLTEAVGNPELGGLQIEIVDSEAQPT
ncbi:hypothetical protein PA10_00007 [Pseudomonas phage pPa_SNUABM_DT01]|nr:hypothetical protein PA10_00007 [Pseudomonas phage pPa_SNUABM_DT01]